MAKQTKSYDSYEEFLRNAITGYWESGSASKVNFLALLLACREAWQVAWDQVTDRNAGKKILAGAAGATALTLLLRAVLGGPLGLLLTGGSIAALVAVYVKNHKRIWAKVNAYSELIDGYRAKYEEVQTDYAEERLRKDQRDLMCDGLMSRFLVELDEIEVDPDEDEAPDDEDAVEEAESAGEFARHAARKKAEQERASAPEEGGGDQGGDSDGGSRESD